MTSDIAAARGKAEREAALAEAEMKQLAAEGEEKAARGTHPVLELRTPRDLSMLTLCFAADVLWHAGVALLLTLCALLTSLSTR